jgi:hypothetical protein
MKITFRKILEYELYPTNQKIKKFGYICDVLNQNIDPPTKQPENLQISTGVVFCSSLRRAKECVAVQSGTRVWYIPEIAEIPFELSQFCLQSEWDQLGSIAVRKYFKKAFVQDELLIPRKSIEKQVLKVTKLIQEYCVSDLISHTFRIIIMRAYYETGGRIFKNPNLIHRYIFDNRRILNFGESFELDI